MRVRPQLLRIDAPGNSTKRAGVPFPSQNHPPPGWQLPPHERAAIKLNVFYASRVWVESNDQPWHGFRFNSSLRFVPVNLVGLYCFYQKWTVPWRFLLTFPAMRRFPRGLAASHAEFGGHFCEMSRPRTLSNGLTTGSEISRNGLRLTCVPFRNWTITCICSSGGICLAFPFTIKKRAKCQGLKLTRSVNVSAWQISWPRGSQVFLKTSDRSSPKILASSGRP